MTGFLALTISTVAIASPAAAVRTVYADTCVEPESGDIAGYVVTVTHMANKVSVSFAWAEGAMMQSVPATISSWDAKGGVLRFSVKTNSGLFTFDGRNQAVRLVGAMTSPFDDKPAIVQLYPRSTNSAFFPKNMCT